MADPDLLRLMRQIRAEAELLRVVAHEADTEVATIVAATRRRRELEELRREQKAARSSKRAPDIGDDR